MAADPIATPQVLTERDEVGLEKIIALPAPFLFRRLPVQLPDYEGSAELLLWLLRRQLVGVGEVAVSVIARQIGRGIGERQATADGGEGRGTDALAGREEAVKDLPLTMVEEVAIAAELVWVKSALLLPQPEEVEPPEPETEGDEPLKRRLLRHAAYGLAAKFLAERGKVWSQMFPRPTTDDLPAPVKELVLGDNPSAMLLEALRRVLARMAGAPVCPSRRLTVPQRLRIVWRSLRNAPEGMLSFDALCADCHSLLEVIVTFLAVLELVRRGIVGARQDEPFGPILLFLRTSRDG